MAQDSHIVTMDFWMPNVSVYGLPNTAISNDLKWPQRSLKPFEAFLIPVRWKIKQLIATTFLPTNHGF